MNPVQPGERANLETIWKAAEALKNSEIPVLRYYAVHVMTETSTIFDQLLLHPPSEKRAGR